MKNYLILVSGPPGSGKDTFAYGMLAGSLILSADDFMVNKLGEYDFDRTRLGECHQTCQALTREALAKGMNVAVCNTFTKAWEAAPYKQMAKDAGAVLVVCDVRGDFENVHGCPPEKVERMRREKEAI
jgi:predicted kinase